VSCSSLPAGGHASFAAPGDRLELREGPDGYILKPRRIDYSKLGTLRDKIKPGTPPFDIRKFRDEGYDPDKYRD